MFVSIFSLWLSTYVVLEFNTTKGFIEQLAPLSNHWQETKRKTSEQGLFVIKPLNLTKLNFLLEMMKRMTVFESVVEHSRVLEQKKIPQRSYTSELQFTHKRKNKWTFRSFCERVILG